MNAARSVCGFTSKIEVECCSAEEGREAAGAGADVVMLDNLRPQVETVKGTQALVISDSYCLIFSHFIISSSLLPCPSPTGTPCCSTCTEGGVPNSFDRGQWRNNPREPSCIFFSTCGHYFPGLYNTGLPCCGLFSEGSKAWYYKYDVCSTYVLTFFYCVHLLLGVG